MVLTGFRSQLDGTNITDFKDCDFTPIFAYLEGEKAKKKEMTAADKKLAKAARDIVEEPYKTCLLDGRKEIVGNFRVEPPGLFRGRGEHPRTGLLKVRVAPGRAGPACDPDTALHRRACARSRSRLTSARAPRSRQHPRATSGRTSSTTTRSPGSRPGRRTSTAPSSELHLDSPISPTAH